MMRRHSLRFRMMLLFSTVVTALLAGSYLAFYAALAREVRAQLDRQLLEVSQPVLADISTDPNEQDVAELNLPDEYFEMIDASGRVLQCSANLASRPLDLGGPLEQISSPDYRTVRDPVRGRLRLAIIPFGPPGRQSLHLAVALPTRDSDQVLSRFRNLILVLLPLSLLATCVVSAWYVGRSLRPVVDLTRHAEQMTARLSDPEKAGAWEPLSVANPNDEIGRLAENFNRLFARTDSAFGQLRQFASDASHELRTPLAVILGETELLLAEPRPPEEYSRALRVIHDELRRLSRMVEGLFTLSMADAGRLRVVREPLYLQEVLEESCHRAGALARDKGITIERHLTEEVPFAGDEAFLRQLFLIFLENAVKYSPSGTRVRVTLAKIGSGIQATFQDEGVGISDEHLPRIFERFYRAAPPDNGDAHSGGLGLAIAQAIVRALGGSIVCTSTPGKGSTFTVSLPDRPSCQAPRSAESQAIKPK